MAHHHHHRGHGGRGIIAYLIFRLAIYLFLNSENGKKSLTALGGTGASFFVLGLMVLAISTLAIDPVLFTVLVMVGAGAIVVGLGFGIANAINTNVKSNRAAAVNNVDHFKPENKADNDIKADECIVPGARKSGDYKPAPAPVPSVPASTDPYSAPPAQKPSPYNPAVTTTLSGAAAPSAPPMSQLQGGEGGRPKFSNGR